MKDLPWFLSYLTCFSKLLAEYIDCRELDEQKGHPTCGCRAEARLLCRRSFRGYGRRGMPTVGSVSPTFYCQNNQAIKDTFFHPTGKEGL